MKSCFIIKTDSLCKIAIADLCPYYNLGTIITRINVPEEFRGKGLGRELLKQILDSADAEKQTLFLEIHASGEMTYADLESWYMRHGFKKWKGLYRRISPR